MDWLPAITFLRPHALWGLLALPALWAWWRRRARRDSAWRDVVDPHLLPHLLEAGAGLRRSPAAWWWLAGTLLAVLAMAGPSWRSAPQAVRGGVSPVIVVLEMSATMGARDLPPSRLLQARAKVAELLRARAGGQVGLVVYAEDAFTVAPLTDDGDNVAVFLDALAPEVMPVDGARPSRGIARAAGLLRQAGAEGGDIVLLASAVDPTAVAAAAAAAGDGSRVSVIGIGTAGGASYQRPDGGIATARLEAGALREVAEAGGGRFVALGDGDIAALGLRGGIDAGETGAGATGERVPVDGGFWLLPPLMLLCLFAFRRGAGLAVVLVACLLPWSPARAQEAGAWRRADQAQYQRGVTAETAFRGGDFATAERAWAAVPGATAAYNRGNALARLARFEDALAAYDEALRLSPGMDDAVANRAAVQAAMDRRPPTGPADDQRGERSPGDDGGKPRPDPSGEPGEDGAADPGAGRRQATPASPSAGTGPAADGAPAPDPPRPARDATQQAADAAQRERMRQAQADGAGRDSGAGAAEQPDERPGPAETPAEREARAAREAWLRRVPDDPGGLLRARFRLEHERRMREGTN